MVKTGCGLGKCNAVSCLFTSRGLKRVNKVNGSSRLVGGVGRERAINYEGKREGSEAGIKGEHTRRGRAMANSL